MHSLKVSDFVRHSRNDSPHFGAICRVTKIKEDCIFLAIVVPGKNGRMTWLGNNKNEGIFYSYHFNEKSPRFVKLVDHNGEEYVYNPVVEKIKELESRFKNKTLKKTKVAALPLPH